jgi:hypothetical protein
MNAPHCYVIRTLALLFNMFGVKLNAFECRMNLGRHCTQSLDREFYVELVVSV